SPEWIGHLDTESEHGRACGPRGRAHAKHQPHDSCARNGYGKWNHQPSWSARLQDDREPFGRRGGRAYPTGGHRRRWRQEQRHSLLHPGHNLRSEIHAGREGHGGWSAQRRPGWIDGRKEFFRKLSFSCGRARWPVREKKEAVGEQASDDGLNEGASPHVAFLKEQFHG